MGKIPDFRPAFLFILLALCLAIGPPAVLAEPLDEAPNVAESVVDCAPASLLASAAFVAPVDGTLVTLKQAKPFPIGSLIGLLGAIVVGVVIPTVQVRTADGKSGIMNINRSDYEANRDKYELAEADAEDTGTAGGDGGDGEPPNPPSGPEFASSAAEKYAADNKIDPKDITPTGKDGKITKPDVEAIVEALKEGE